jgi:hypothetical protein
MGRMQSTGHTGTQLASLQQFCVITYVTDFSFLRWRHTLLDRCLIKSRVVTYGIPRARVRGQLEIPKIVVTWNLTAPIADHEPVG